MIRWSPAYSPAAAKRPSCPHRRLRRLLTGQLPAGLSLGASILRPWASANFVGARHIFPASGELADPGALQERLAATEWRLAGHIVADVAVEQSEGEGEGALRIEILTVEE